MQLETVFNSYQLKCLPQLVREKKLHSYDMGTEDSYLRNYEIHNDYKKILNRISNHTSGWTEVVTQEWLEVVFDPAKNVRWRINNDVYEYSPEQWFTKNKSVCYNYWEWFNKYKKSREGKGITNINISGFDDDIKEGLLDMFDIMKDEQKQRRQWDTSEWGVNDLISNLE